MLKRKQKMKVIFLAQVGKNNYDKIGEKDIKIGEETTVRFGKDKSFPVTVKSYSFISKKTPIIFIDVDNNKVLIFKEKDIGINPTFLDKFITTSKVGIIGQLMHVFKMQENQKTDWGILAKPVIIFILGAVIGWFIGGGHI